MTIEYLSEIVNSEEVLDAAFAQPSMQRKPRSKKDITKDQAVKAILIEVERSVVAHVADAIADALQEALDDHVGLYGEYAEATDIDEWTSPLDEQVEAIIAPFVPQLSQSWLGEHTIDTGVQDPDGVQKFCASLGKELYKQLTYNKGKLDPAKILSNAGITTPVIEERLDAINHPTKEETAAMVQQQDAQLEDIYGKIAFFVGDDHDANELLENLELVVDDDDGLAFGAGARIGIEEADVEVLRGLFIEHGRDAAQVAQHGIMAALGQEIPETKKKGKGKAKAPKAAAAEDEDDLSFLNGDDEAPATPAAKPAKKAPSAKKTVASDSEVLEGSVLATVKDLGAGDTETAKALGVSRQTYVNYTKGTTEFKPTEDQRALIRGLLVDKANAALEALAAIDGTEADTVF